MDEEYQEDILISLREEQTRLIKILECFARLETSEEWITIRELVFDKELASVERQLLNASLEMIDLQKIYHLQGQRFQIKKYETERYIESLKKQLEEIKKKLK